MNLLFQIQNAYQSIPQPKIISRKMCVFYISVAFIANKFGYRSRSDSILKCRIKYFSETFLISRFCKKAFFPINCAEIDFYLLISVVLVSVFYISIQFKFQ
jgi:hypothetical protein